MPNWRRTAAVVVTVLLSVSCGSDNDSGPVSAVDSVVNDIPQLVSLSASLDDGDLTVTNDGNVTMSDVVVEDGSGDTVCELGTIAPLDDSICEDAPGTWTVKGEGPQGQPAETSS